MAKFRNPANGYVQTVDKSSAFWGCFFFGVAYFAYKGVWTHAVIALIAAICTAGISWFVYPFFAYQCVTTSYLERGWQEVGKGPKGVPSKRRRPGPSFDGIDV